ncbi:site-specific integrase [Virgibacillus necropolis]|uniref:tyrosine-type recombinase/integrase n=1 Tax=Virgibacillus necropolis TaxID=163877 RepID=UPI0038508C7B
MATFRKLKSGKWQSRVYIDGERKSIGAFNTKKEAEIRANEVENKVYYNKTIVDRKIPFKTVIDDWFSQKKRTVKDSTFEQLEVIKRLHIEPYFGRRRLFNINRNDVIEWMESYEGNKKYSYGTRLKHLSTLKDIFYHAIHELELLDKNPAARLKIAKPDEFRNLRKDVKYYSLGELNTLLNYLKGYESPRFKEYKVYYALIFLLSRTGLRISEVLALRWSDLNGHRLDISKQTARNDNNELRIASLKTFSSYRNIEIDENTIELLGWFKKIQNDCISKYDKFKRNKDVIIFQTYNGNYMTPSTVRDTLAGHCLNAGIEYKGTHTFRHTHAVLSLEAGTDLLYLSKRLGHGSIKTTADTYLDITPQFESQELEKISNYLNN